MTSGALCRRMKTQPANEALKDVRVVVRVDKPTADWLEQKARAEECSVSRIIRLALRKAKSTNSFNGPDRQPVGDLIAA